MWQDLHLLTGFFWCFGAKSFWGKPWRMWGYLLPMTVLKAAFLSLPVCMLDYPLPALAVILLMPMMDVSSHCILVKCWLLPSPTRWRCLPIPFHWNHWVSCVKLSVKQQDALHARLRDVASAHTPFPCRPIRHDAPCQGGDNCSRLVHSYAIVKGVFSLDWLQEIFSWEWPWFTSL
jgi:hypothetical protein